jgi:CheY-like chemotaxis protein
MPFRRLSRFQYRRPHLGKGATRRDGPSRQQGWWSTRGGSFSLTAHYVGADTYYAVYSVSIGSLRTVEVPADLGSFPQRRVRATLTGDTIATHQPGRRMDTGQSKHRLLLVDGDPKSLRVLEVSLKKAGFEVVTATQGAEALGALQVVLPDLIISDTDLDGMDGFDLCRQIKAKPEWAKIPFLFVSGRKSIEDKIRGLELGVEDYLTKPIYIKEIGIRVRTALQRAERERLESRREGRTKFAGDLADIGVVDLVQTIDLNRKSGIIHIVNRDGRRGAVFFREGRVIDAEVGRLSGAEAMYRLFSWSDGRFEVEFKPIRRRDVIDLPSAALLMEGMRRLDEWTRLLEKMPSLDCVVEVDVGVLAEQLVDLPDEMNGILRLCDGTRNLLAVIDDSDFPDLEALTIVSKLFGQGTIYSREPAAQQTEPSNELARWLAEGHAEDGAVADEASAAQQFVTEAEGTGAISDAAKEPAAASDDVRASGERQSSKTLKTFSLDAAMLSLDTPPPGREAPGATAELDSVAPGAKLTGKTLRLPSTLTDQEIPPSASAPAPSPTAPMTADAASPLEDSAVVEDSSRVPVDPAIALARTPPGGFAAMPDEAVPPRASGKPDTLRGFPIPDGLAEPDQASFARKSALTDDDRPARTTIEFGPRERDVAPTARAGGRSGAEPAAETARETDWGGWGQGVEREPAADADAPPPPLAEAGVAAGASLAAGEPGQEAISSAAESAQGRACISEEVPQARALDPPEGTPAFHPSANEQTVRVRPGLDKLGSDVVPHEHRWLPFAVALALLVAGGLLVMRIGPSGSRSLSSAKPELPHTTAPTASVSSAVETGAGLVDRGLSQAATPVAAEKQVAAPVDAQANPAGSAQRQPTTQPPVVSGEAPSRAADSGHGRPPTPVAAKPEDPRDRCLKADAGGRGKPMVVLAACRPAAEAEPEAADIMLIVARAELDRGRAIEARSWAKKALAVNPDLADAYLLLGGAEQEADNPAEAKAAYKKYLELAPTGRHARDLRAIIDNL